MADNLTVKQRSQCMSRIHSKWTSPERKIHAYLKGDKIKHKMHPSLPGNPDILLVTSRTVVFLQGCFWHKCPKCYVEPKSRKSYWLPKLEKNVERDKRAVQSLKRAGYKVLIIWEHEIKSNFKKIIRKLQKL